MSSEAETNVSSYNPEEWLASSGKKFSRYYYKTQGPIKFKMGKISGPGVGNRSSKRSNDTAPMIHPEEIKITTFEYPDPENGEYKRGPVRHVQSINPYLTATNMLDALKLVIGGDPVIAAHEAEISSAQSEVSRLEKKKAKLEKDINALKEQYKEVEAKTEAEIQAASVPGATVSEPRVAPGGVAFNVKGGGRKQDLKSIQDSIKTKTNELAAINQALQEATQKLNELKSKEVKGSQAKTDVVSI